MKIRLAPSLPAERGDGAGERLAQADEEMQQRRLAGAIGANDGYSLARMQIEINTVEYAPAAGVAEGNVAQRHQRRGRRCHRVYSRAISNSNAATVVAANTRSLGRSGAASTA